MDTVKAAIERDGIYLARVPPHFEMEVTKFGGTDPYEMLKFRLASFPRDTSSWRFIEVSTLTLVHRLKMLIRLAGEGESRKFEQNNLNLAMFGVIDMNIFHDLLYTLLRRFYSSWSELMVSTRSAYIARMKKYSR
jgi:hypothetical protein